MENAIREFGKKLKSYRGAGLFYYAGHGMQIGGINYLIPIGARVEKETDVKFQTVNAEMMLAEMENAENGMNIVLLDACRDKPFGRSFRSASRGLSIISNEPNFLLNRGNQPSKDVMAATALKRKPSFYLRQFAHGLLS